jgi:type IV pilus assembly protein PilQ
MPLIAQPEVIIQENQSEILQPSTPVAPLLPRAVAPPVGDIAISNIDATANTIDLGTAAIVPRLVLREAPAKEVLAVLARYAGLNLIFTDTQGEEAAQEQTISLDLENESVQEVFNSVLMVSGLQANRRGRTIFVGSSLPQGARDLISRTLRLNQVSAANAATYLASQGAEYQRLVTEQEDIVDPLTNRVVGRRDKPPTLEALKVTKEEGSTAAFLLEGLTVGTDERLNSITLIGTPRQVQIATSMLSQLDARRRQAVVNVKVVDVQLRGEEYYNSSFSFGFDDGFFVNDGGTAILNFGGINPANAAESRAGAFSQPVISLSDALGGNTPNIFYDRQNAPFNNFTSGTVQYFDQDPNSPTVGQIVELPQTAFVRPDFGTNNNPLQPGVVSVPGFETIQVGVDISGNPILRQVPTPLSYAPPSLFQYPQKFLLTLEAQVTSGNAKILTDPTLVVQEGQQATVKLTQKVVESVNTQVDPLSGVRTTTPVLADAGLTLSVQIDRIDDNGFINLYVSPTIAAPGGTERFESGAGTTNILTLLTRREMTSGLIRLRDGQTLILSGVISDTERTTVSKVPILGDIPILGALFRETRNEGERSEVIILLTPRIIDDNTNAPFGYSYTPGSGAADVLRQQGFPVQPQP